MTDNLPTTAAEWIARMNAGPLSPEMEAAFQSWLEGDSRRRADFVLARLTWSVAQRLEESAIAQKELQALSAPAAAPRKKWTWPWAAEGRFVPFFARRLAPAFGVLVFLLVGAGWILNSGSSIGGGSVLRDGDKVATAIGEIARYTLPDGSTVTVNARSSVRVDFTWRERKVYLESGQAFFEVQRANKPFVVAAGSREVVVTGTKFDVNMDSYRTGIQVAVVEGHVNVGDQHPKAQAVTSLRADDVFLFPDNGPPERLAVAANLVATWQSRRLHFEGTKVGDVLLSVNRFAPKPLQLKDPRLAELPLSGTFNAADTDAVLFSLKSLYGIEAVDAGGTVLLQKTPQ